MYRFSVVDERCATSGRALQAVYSERNTTCKNTFAENCKIEANACTKDGCDDEFATIFYLCFAQPYKLFKI